MKSREELKVLLNKLEKQLLEFKENKIRNGIYEIQFCLKCQQIKKECNHKNNYAEYDNSFLEKYVLNTEFYETHDHEAVIKLLKWILKN